MQEPNWEAHARVNTYLSEHWRQCYFRLLGKKIAEGKIVKGHVATPKDAEVEVKRLRQALGEMVGAWEGYDSDCARDFEGHARLEKAAEESRRLLNA